MTRKVSKDQERLWSEDTVSLGRATEAEPEKPKPIRAPLAHTPRRLPGRALAGCAVVLASVAIAILAMGGERNRSAPAPVRVPAAQTMRRFEVLQKPKTSNAANRRHHQLESHRRHHPEPVPELETPPLPPVSVEPDAVAPLSPPTSPESEPVPQPTPPSTEFGIEHSS